ncbi:MAG: WD40 repeat domain-containing protein [Methylobacteriaceae bacterium]|nr:WD40 repeat domain-containing protein [Methylobacteriaceae bacterium]
MSQPRPSLGEHTTSIDAGAHVIAAAFLGRTPALALGDGTILLVDAGEPRRLTVHPDAAILVAAAEGDRLVTGGDDGRVVVTRADGTIETAANEKGQWIDAVATRGDGAIAWSSGKAVRARDAKGEVRGWSPPSSVRGLCFTPKGYRLACAHYNGASLWFPNASAAPEFLQWKGSHLDVTVSPDGRFLVTCTQENALHGWRILDRTQMQMRGYSGKPRSLAWSNDGEWLATSGAEACILWPFQGKDGPIGKAPRECAVRPARVSRVAFHPKALLVALGYEDGFVMLCRLSDAAEIFVRQCESGAAVTALAWDLDGRRLLFGTAAGEAGLVSPPA